MAAFDIEEAALQGRGEAIPPVWARFAVSRSAIWTNFTIYTVGAVLTFGLAAYLFIAGSLPGGSNGDDGLAPIEFVALLACGCLFLSVGLRLIPPLRKSSQYFFLVTPDGFVFVAGKKLIGSPFTKITSAYRQPGLLGGKLVVLREADRSLALRIGHFYSVQTIREIEEALVANLKPVSRSKPAKRT
ncbi:MAG TPA: hypothetical protein VH599_04365 [Ktedonobacterales bacterium]|jgi:hypothetical protein